MDQADRLRGLIRRSAISRGGRTIVVTSGKGGVGKSQVALNLAIALAARGRVVALVDFAALGGLELLAGLPADAPLAAANATSLHELRRSGPAGVQLVSGAAAWAEAHVPRGRLIVELAELESRVDDLILDAPCIPYRPVNELLSAADITLLLTTPEPPAVADAYAAIKQCGTNLGQVELLVTGSEHAEQAACVSARLTATAAAFLHLNIGEAGAVPYDPAVCRAALTRIPFVLAAADGPAARAIALLAERLLHCPVQTPVLRLAA